MTQSVLEEKGSVLFIDDDETLCVLARKFLEREGFFVETAHSATLGLEKVSSTTFDVVALDQTMPDGLGIDILAKINKLHPPPPVVFVTGDDDVKMAVDALKAGAADYVVKTTSDAFLPFLSTALSQAIKYETTRRAQLDAEEKLRAQIDRAQLLLREINHRVGNSLSLVASLVRMQADATDNEFAQTALEETQSRIVAIGRLHASLNLGDDVRRVDIADYLDSLCSDLENSYTSPEGGVTIARDVESIFVRTDRAISIGLIVTELAINALKYAYPGDLKGEVRVILKSQDNDHLCLRVEDDGIGVPIDRAKSHGGGLGTQIVDAMSESLDCKPIVTVDNGTRVELIFSR